MSELNGFSDEILDQLSQIGIEMCQKPSKDDIVPRAIYELSKIKAQKEGKGKNGK